jgi:hypothetical protein
MHIPHIPIPQSLADAQALQAAAMLTITIRPTKAELPTSRAAEKIEDILREDDGCMEGDSDGEGADDDASGDVATDALSDSESESDEEDADVNVTVSHFSGLPTQRLNDNCFHQCSKRREFAAQNVAALGEQAISRTVFQLREMGSTFANLSEYLDQRVTGLTSDERDEVGRGYGQLVNLMAKMERVLNLPAPTPALPPVDQSQSRPSAVPSTCTEAAAVASQIGIKRKQLLPPSPEKLQKRHQSHAIH